MAIQPISVRLDDDVRAALEEDAQGQHIGLATYLRRLAAERAALLRKTRIRSQSRRIGELVATDPEARAFYADAGTPLSDL
jgi:hypothetical protein